MEGDFSKRGVIVTPMITASGGFALNGEPFAGGDLTPASGSVYALTLADGKWCAANQTVMSTLTLRMTGRNSP